MSRTHEAKNIFKKFKPRGKQCSHLLKDHMAQPWLPRCLSKKQNHMATKRSTQKAALVITAPNWKQPRPTGGWPNNGAFTRQKTPQR